MPAEDGNGQVTNLPLRKARAGCTDGGAHLTDSKQTKEALSALAEQSGLPLSADRLEEVWPHMRQTLLARARTRKLDVGDAQPATAFHAAPGVDVAEGRRDNRR